MLQRMTQIDSTLVIVLHNGEQKIERKLASPTEAARVALLMLARRGRLEIGDVLKVVRRTEREGSSRNLGELTRAFEARCSGRTRGAQVLLAGVSCRTSAHGGGPDQ